MGAMWSNVIRQRENLPRIAEGDCYFRPANWLELGEPSPTQPASCTCGAGDTRAARRPRLTKDRIYPIFGAGERDTPAQNFALEVAR